MAERGMRLDATKCELIHHSWRHADKGKLECPMPLPAMNENPATTVTAAPQVKWLGVIFDRKLTFVEHLRTVCERAERAVSAIQMLGNSIHGLNQYHRHQLYIGGILPMMTYASTTWWSGQKQQTKLIAKVQNKALRQITGGFRTTPVYAMEIEASIPPIAITLHHLNDCAANRMCHLGSHHPVALRLPSPLREAATPQADTPVAALEPHTRMSTGAPPFPLPHKRTGLRGTPEQREANLRKKDECTPLWKIATRIMPNSERIDKFAAPPWHRCEMSGPRARIKKRIPPPTPGESPKTAWAKAHKETVERLQQDDKDLLVYTDGSSKVVEGVRQTGVGVTAYWKGRTIFTARGAMGPYVESYDTEMEALARGAKRVNEWMREAGEEAAPIKNIHFYTDNTGAIHRIYKATPGKAQACSTRFRNSIHDTLDRYPNCDVTIEWVPSHQDVTGNDAADREAKWGRRETVMHDYRSAAFAANMRKGEMAETWKTQWDQDTGQLSRTDFQKANKLTPQIHPTRRMRELPRETFSRVFQCRTGHAHIGSYYRRFLAEENTECPCGDATIQTREHILRECTLHDTHRSLLLNDERELNIEELVGSEKGIDRLADFLEKSNAYTKH
jgi:ribonuclease HI